MLNYYSGSDYLSIRNKMIALLFDTGVRCNEMIMMEPEDVAHDYIVVRHGMAREDNLTDFLLQFIKYGRGKKFAQCHIQTIAQLLDYIDGDFLSPAIKHTINGGRCNAGQVRQLICPHISLFQYLHKACYDRIFNSHTIISFKKMIEIFTQWRIRTCVISKKEVYYRCERRCV